MSLVGKRIHITGTVQGVGFRPFVYGLATRLGLFGWVRNTSAGVDIEVVGQQDQLATFLDVLRAEAPPLAHIAEIQAQDCPPNGYTSFEIIHSEEIAGAFQPISPDVAICADCLRELFDPADRRYRYPFINCTNCGPRFTIIEDIPYDRPKTTMAAFPLCPECAAEYHDPLNRRFHAQPVACPVCGPRVWLEISPTSQSKDIVETGLTGDDAIQQALELLRRGKILAIKGLGGFHLACDATNAQAIALLRQRKFRVDKPFAVMMADPESVAQHCLLNEVEREMLVSRARPIVILKRRPDSTVAAEVAPGQDTLGVMLPYTPLHYLLFSTPPLPPPEALVMTSGNLSEEPIATENDEARQRLAPLADAFLMHNRPIHTRCDDSVVRVFSIAPSTRENVHLRPESSLYPVRRARGYAPSPIELPFPSPPLLATGAELKNTFCLAKEQFAFLSHHIGDMENYETLRAFEEGIAHFERLFRVQPAILACDLHPDYLATRYAQARAEASGLPLIAVQHHHAHIASCMVEHNLPQSQPVIGLAFDGTGYGPDGAIWGGEFLLADYTTYSRLGHLAYMPLPGGDAAIRKPARVALAALWQAGVDWDLNLPPAQALCMEERTALRAQLEHRLNTPLTSSIGRLFDAVAALIGVRAAVNYEAQAAIELEALVAPTETGFYEFEVTFQEGQIIADPKPVLQAIVGDFYSHVPKPIIAARFHNGLAEMIRQVTLTLSHQCSIRQVVLSGGVWQNMTLLSKTVNLLQENKLEAYIHRQAPTNDGGIALGQVAIAACQTRWR